MSKDSAESAELDDRAQELREHRKLLVEADVEVSLTFDRLLATLAAGALLLSIGFASELTVESLDPGWLYLAWLGFGASLVSILLSHQLSHESITVEIRRIDAELELGDEPEGENRPGTATRWFNYASMATLAMGAAFLAIFVARNL